MRIAQRLLRMAQLGILVTVMLEAEQIGLNLTTEEALQVLNSAIVDVKNNYASEAINYHLTQLSAEKEA